MTLERKIKITLITGHLSGSNTAILYKLMPEHIEQKYDIQLVSEHALANFEEELIDSDVFITTHGYVPYVEGKIYIELWHGFPLKAMGLMYGNEKVPYESITNYWKQVDMIFSYSPLYNTVLNACVAARATQYYVTGMPRNDVLVEPSAKTKLSSLIQRPLEDERIVFYLPTFRDADLSADRNDEWTNLFGFEQFDEELFKRFLVEHNIILIVKLHQYERRFNDEQDRLDYDERIINLSNDTLSHSGIDLYEVLGACDALITDYSGVYFDYLLLDRPIIFTPTDLEQYESERGFIVDPYEAWTPGPKALDQSALQEAITTSLTNPTWYAEERVTIKNMVHTYADHSASSRVWQKIDQYVSLKSSDAMNGYEDYRLGHDDMMGGEWETAKQHFRRALSKGVPSASWYAPCLAGLMKALLQLDEIDEAWDLIQTEMQAEHAVLFDALQGMLLEHLGFDKLAEERLLAATQRFAKTSNKWDDNLYPMAMQKLASIYYRKKQLDQTIKALVQCLVSDPHDMSSLKLLLQLLSQTQSTDDLIKLIYELYGELNNSQLRFLFHAILQIGHKDLAIFINSICEANKTNIQPNDKLRLFILLDDREQFISQLEGLSMDELSQQDIKTSLRLATIIWPNTSDLISQATPQKPLSEWDQQQRAEILIELFRLQHYEVFDQLIANWGTPFIINECANYFYHINQIDLATSYYSNLLEHHADQIDAIGFTNLAFLHFNSGHHSDGLQFLDIALQKFPSHVKLYVYGYQHAESRIQQDHYKQRLLQQFPQYDVLPFVTQL